MIALSGLSGNASTANARLVSAGAVAPQLSLASTANQCSFAQLVRGSVRGGPYVVVTADLPQSSLYVSFLRVNLDSSHARSCHNFWALTICSDPILTTYLALSAIAIGS